MATLRLVPKGHPLVKRKAPRAIYFKWLLVSMSLNVLSLAATLYLLLRN